MLNEAQSEGKSSGDGSGGVVQHCNNCGECAVNTKYVLKSASVMEYVLFPSGLLLHAAGVKPQTPYRFLWSHSDDCGRQIPGTSLLGKASIIWKRGIVRCNKLERVRMWLVWMGTKLRNSGWESGWEMCLNPWRVGHHRWQPPKSFPLPCWQNSQSPCGKPGPAQQWNLWSGTAIAKSVCIIAA